MTLYKLEELFKAFDDLPKTKKQPTYLELCKYPRRRFEEICSRLLCFYLSPKGEHGFNDLFIHSLLEILSPEVPFTIKADNIHVKSEENAEGKRLDILIYSNDFVIGIENKVTANIYNPLEVYKNRIDQYSSKNRFRVVLSLKKITDKHELQLLNNSNFIRLTYAEYFNVIKRNLGFYIDNTNSKYLTYLTDFIQTLENMNGQNVLNNQLSDFFYDKYNDVEEMISLFNQHKNKISDIQKERISELKDKISDRTGSVKWWAWEGWDLGINDFNSKKPKIGVESNFEVTKRNPLGKFVIYISTWTLNDWNFYEERILRDFPNKLIEKRDNRAFLHVDVIFDNNEEAILKSLQYCFDYVTEITKDQV
ncbi:MAG: PD-(D/E)XK nuclease family protein [Heyndrickxia sp.]